MDNISNTVDRSEKYDCLSVANDGTGFVSLDVDTDDVVDGSKWAVSTANTNRIVYGDANLDLICDINDIFVALNTANWQQAPTGNAWAVADINNDGITDINDIFVMLNTANWQDQVVPPTGAGVPEPATMTLLALGGLALIRRRRR
jgi:hypothetical protein